MIRKQLHLESCIWYSVTMLRYMEFQQQKTLEPGSPEEKIDREMMWLPPTYRNIEHEDLLVQFYEGSIWHRYSFIFYSCVLISSGNEIAPITTIEVSFNHLQACLATIYIILGLILTGVILGNISDAIEDVNKEETQLERGLDELQVNLKYHKVPPETQEKILVFMQFCYKEKVDFNQSVGHFSYLSKVLRKELLCHEYDQLQRNVSLFSALDNSAIYEICSHFRYRIDH